MTTRLPASTAAASLRSRYAFGILTAVATLFVFVQFFTSSEFIRARGETEETWTEIHGWTAYGMLVPALVAAIVAVVALRRAAPVLTGLSIAFFVASVGQWGSGHLISTFDLDGWTPFHVFFSSAVLALAIWLSVRSFALRRVDAAR